MTIDTTVTVKFQRNLILRFIIFYLSLYSNTLVVSGSQTGPTSSPQASAQAVASAQSSSPHPCSSSPSQVWLTRKRFLIPTFLPPPGPPGANSQSLCTFPEDYYVSGYTYVCENPAGADCLVYHDSRCLHNAPSFSVSSLSASHTTHPILDKRGPRYYEYPSPFYKRGNGG